MAVRVYRWDDAGAPVLQSNTAGRLIAVLDACLVNGYGAKAAAGWSKPFSGTNLAAYRQGSGSNGMYLRVDDTDATASGSRSARVVGYETMSGINTGSPGSFPANAQLNGGMYWPTSAGTVTTASQPKSWVVIADEKFFYLYIETWPETLASTSTQHYRELLGFGDINSYRPGDAFHTVLWGQATSTPNSSDYKQMTADLLSTQSAYLYLARKYDQLGGSINANKHNDFYKSLSSPTLGLNGVPYPHPVDGGLYLSPVWVGESSTGVPCVRGLFPGLWVPTHSQPFNAHDIFSGSGAFAGKTFYGIRLAAVSAAIETSDWRT